MAEDQTPAGHRLRLRHAQKGEDRGGDVGQLALSGQGRLCPARRKIGQDERDGVPSVAGVRLPVRVEPLFDRAVVGRDDQGRPGCPGGGRDPAELPVDRLDGRDRGRPVLDMADDVDVGEVGQDEVVRPRGQGGGDFVGHPAGAHFGSEVVVPKPLGRRDDPPLFPGENLVRPPVQKKADVERLFGFGDFEQAQTRPADGLGQRIPDPPLFGKSHPDRERGVIFDHRREMKAEGSGHRKTGESRLDEAAGDLDLALPSEVVENDGVPGADSAPRLSPLVRPDEGGQGFVLLSGPVSPADGFAHDGGTGSRVVHRLTRKGLTIGAVRQLVNFETLVIK